uniref:ATP synthase complex subunit 8 n=1 Tax=Deielia phaon TaxID=411009 RepID=A0A4Y5SDW0_9ODON|nr:ATP synthase F0 subunit 8 [Deielia phaon]
MPQMAPMSWILLFIFFSVMLILINMMNYYLFTPKMNLDSGKKISIKKSYWTW